MKALFIAALLIACSSASFFNKIGDGIKHAVDQVTHAADSVAHDVTHVADSAWSDVSDEAHSVGDHINTQAQSIGNHVKSIANTVASHVQSQAQSIGNHAASIADTVASHAVSIAHDITEEGQKLVNQLGVAIPCGQAIAAAVPVLAKVAKDSDTAFITMVQQWNGIASNIADVVGNCGGTESEASKIRDLELDSSEEQEAECVAAVGELIVAVVQLDTIETDPNPEDITGFINSAKAVIQYCPAALHDLDSHLEF